MIIKALERTGGQRTLAAEQLGISRRTLSRKLKEYNINFAPGETTASLGFISNEQQKFFRTRVQIPVTVKNSQGEEISVQGVNLSTGGMGLDGIKEPLRFRRIARCELCAAGKRNSVPGQSAADVGWRRRPGRHPLCRHRTCPVRTAPALDQPEDERRRLGIPRLGPCFEHPCHPSDQIILKLFPPTMCRPVRAVVQPQSRE